MAETATAATAAPDAAAPAEDAPVGVAVYVYMTSDERYEVQPDPDPQGRPQPKRYGGWVRGSALGADGILVGSGYRSLSPDALVHDLTETPDRRAILDRQYPQGWHVVPCLPWGTKAPQAALDRYFQMQAAVAASKTSR